jgi:hypothetical protein
MAKVYDGIDERLAAFLLRQPVFFVGTAPRADDGHVNVSPKGLAGTLAVLDDHRLAYLDLTGSGIETVAHLQENGRIVLMFCAFSGPPRIVRVHGRGVAHFEESDRFAELRPLFPPMPGVRSIIEIEAVRVSDSCGYGVPEMRVVQERTRLVESNATKEGAGTLAEYRANNNARSLDGLPGLPV